MKEKFPEDPKVLTLSAMIIGYILLGDYTANEQNALGNWFMLVGQVLETNSAFQQITEKNIKADGLNINSKKYKSGGSAFVNEQFFDKENLSNADLNKIKEMLEHLLEKINKLN